MEATSSLPVRPGVCENCRNLVKSKLTARNTHFRPYFGEEGSKCPLCQLVDNGLELVEGEMGGFHRTWEVHVQNGLVLSAQDNGPKELVEFYFTKGETLTFIRLSCD
jgi:hypothetical protein